MELEIASVSWCLGPFVSSAVFGGCSDCSDSPAGGSFRDRLRLTPPPGISGAPSPGGAGGGSFGDRLRLATAGPLLVGVGQPAGLREHRPRGAAAEAAAAVQ